MAVYLSNGVVVTLNSVALSDHVTSATINRAFDELEVTAMGDTAAANVNATLQAAWGTTVTLTLKQTNAATSATNPLYSTTVLVNNTTDINGAVADIATQSITFTCNSVIVISTS